MGRLEHIVTMGEEVMIDRIRNEPAAAWGHVTVLLEAIIGVGILFNWWTWTDAQTGGVLLVLAALGSGLSWLVRSQVTPVA